MSDEKSRAVREESPEDHIYFQPNGSAVVENVGKF